MDLNDKINKVIDFGEKIVAETKRKLKNHQLKLLEQDKVKLDSKMH